MSTDPGEPSEAETVEAETYEVLQEHDVDEEPPHHRPIAPGDVFVEVAIDHLATPFAGAVMVVGHPCSLRRGIALQEDVPVAPIAEPGLPTAQQPTADRVLPVGKLVPPGSTANQVVQLTRTTTVPAQSLDTSKRCASLNRAGVVALQQRVVGNQTRVKVPHAVIAAHCRGPLTELELWGDWRDRLAESGVDDPTTYDLQFDAFMREASGFDDLSWRDALGEREEARARAVVAMTARLSEFGHA